MQTSIGAQSRFLLGNRDYEWHLLEADDQLNLSLPGHVVDQVFRVAFCRIDTVLFFEVLVSEQCPKDTYTHIGRAISRLEIDAAIINIVHQRNANGHLVFWHAEDRRRFHHLDLCFSQPSQFDRQVIRCLQEPSGHNVSELFQALNGQSMGGRVFAALKKHMATLPRLSDKHYDGLVHMLLRLIFLIFVQRKGWLNFDPFYLESKMANCEAKGLSILNCFLKPLFSRLEGFDAMTYISLGEVPRLGGGLFRFSPDEAPKIPNSWFLELLHKLLAQFSFSLYEARSDRNIIGVSPEVLGHVFENLLHREHRKNQGVYYTPCHVAEKQARAGIRAYLDNHGAESREAVSRALSQIKVLDPACGSGSYLVAAFQTLLKLRLERAPEHERYNGKLFELKRSIVTENLFGLDISPMAVRLTEVRLWLNMIQDLEVSRPAEAPALPSLQHHLRPGDFLSRYLPAQKDLIRAWPRYTQLEHLRKQFPASEASKRLSILKHIDRLEGELHRYLDARSFAVRKCAVKTAQAQGTLPGHQKQPVKGKHGERGRVARHPLHVLFSDAVLDGGFDVILGNPPWLSAKDISKEEKTRIVENLQPTPGLTLDRRSDLSVYFLLAALNLLRENGHLGFLIPDKFLQAGFARGVRVHLAHHYQIDYLHDYGLDQGLIFNADTFPLAIGVSARRPASDYMLRIERRGREVREAFPVLQSRFQDQMDVWLLENESPALVAGSVASWPKLKDLSCMIKRGVTTNAKRHFVFDEMPDWIPASRLRPLLRGRDIQHDRVQPGAFLYWPFGLGPDWFLKLPKSEQVWLEQTERMKLGQKGYRLPYVSREFGRWMLVWRYLSATWDVALVPGDLGWIPDQTTYYIEFEDYQTAYRYFAFFRSEFAGQYLTAIAERGKDRHFFFYKHTCLNLPIPPDLDKSVMTSSGAPRLLTPHKGNGLWKPSGNMKEVA